MSTEGLAGLGAALSALGDYGIGKQKETLVNKLELEREQRAAARIEAKEKRDLNREAKKVASERPVQTADGKWTRQLLNSDKQVIREEPLNQYEIDKLTRDDQKEQLTIDNLSTTAALSKKKFDNYDADYARDVEYDNARTGSVRATIGATNARADNYRTGGSSSGGIGGRLGGTNSGKKTKAQIKASEEAAAQELIDSGDVPPSLAKYVAKNNVKNGSDTYNASVLYSEGNDEVKKYANEYSKTMEAVAKKVISGEMTEADAVQQFKDNKYPQLAKALPGVIKLIRGK